VSLAVETAPHLNEFELEGPDVWGALPPDTATLLPTYANYDTVLDPLAWFAALTPRGVHLGNNLSARTTLVRAPRPIRLAGTALAFADHGLVLVAAVDGPNGPALDLASIPRPDDAPAESSYAEAARLPGPPVDLATTAGYASDGPILVATTTARSNSTLLEVRRLEGGQAKRALSLVFPDEPPEPGLAVVAGSDGRIRVLLVTRDPKRPGTRTVSFVEGPLEGPLRRVSSQVVEGVALLPEPLLPVPARVLLLETAPGHTRGGVVFLPREPILPPIAWTLGSTPREAPGLEPLRGGGTLLPGRDSLYAAWIEGHEAVSVNPL
jgi:hypothetical protein